ncbi:flagellin [Chromobacterium violaceum]|uniref:flagellin N-terminal helical domain-containing protein n=1 Tax=Chromobacterium violaceum TaxID=536 RepID=UPI000C124C41|nr:flagellin [Chromobacterium violaceum]ATP29367.1 Lateral flagellin [Chromobacterium violaceum]
MLSLHTNIAALNTKSNMNSTQGALSTSMTRLGTGLRINSAMDDAAGLQIATRLDAQSRGMTVAMKNAQNGISMLQTAEGALNEVTNILQRMKDLGTEGANATTTADDKKAMQAEFNQLGKELTNIMKNTSFGGEKLLQGGINAALDAVGTVRSALGANANRLDHVINNLSNVNNNTLAAKGRIMDTDYANESSNMTAKQMLMQASTSMLKQSGSMSSLAMSLLQ